jgi:hypothetical protein
MGCQHGRSIAECPDARCRGQENTADSVAAWLASREENVGPIPLGLEKYDDARRKLYAAFRAYMNADGDGGEGDGRTFADWVKDDADDMTAWWRNRKQAGLE